MPLIGKILWIAGFACLILAWIAVYKKNLVLGLEPLAWYWNALVLGVLAVGMKCDCPSSCSTCDSSVKM